MNDAIRLPTEIEIAGYPALASLAVLDASLLMASAAVAVEHPDLDEMDKALSAKYPPKTTEILATIVIEHIKSLRTAIYRYRAALVPCAERHVIDTDDMPF